MKKTVIQPVSIMLDSIFGYSMRARRVQSIAPSARNPLLEKELIRKAEEKRERKRLARIARGQDSKSAR